MADTDTVTPAQTFFGIYELLEDVLKRLDANDILTFQSVNTFFRDVILSSTQLRADLFLEPSPIIKPYGTGLERHFNIGQTTEGVLENTIRGFPGPDGLGSYDLCRLEDTTPHAKRIVFTSKNDARAVLAKDRTVYSWENMYCEVPAQATRIEVVYLRESNVDMEDGEGENSWLVEHNVHFRVEPTTIGHIMKLAAKLVVADDSAWDCSIEELPGEGEVRAAKYLKFFRQPLDDDVELDLNINTSIQSGGHVLCFHPRAFVAKTWPWNAEVAKQTAEMQYQWLCTTEDGYPNARQNFCRIFDHEEQIRVLQRR